MQMWLLLCIGITVLLVCLYARRWSNKQHEGFDAAGEQKAFADKNITYFRDSVDKGIFTNPGLNIASLNDAMYQPDLFLAKSPDRDFTPYFIPDPENEYKDRDLSMCKGARHPKDLPTRVPRAREGCGWWFVSDPSVPSVGAFGTREGPVLSEGLPANGTWIWNVSTASMKEDIKKCKRIKSCDLINTPGIQGSCGFCARLGYAVPITSNGSEAYPDSTEGSCGEAVVSKRDMCYPIVPQSVVTEDGTDCGTAGRPSSDNSIRLYAKEECNSLAGNWAPNGECLKPGGGSFSWECRDLNKPPKRQPTACDPGPDGKLTRACLISLAKGLGYSPQGSILRILLTSNIPTENDKLAIETLKKIGVSVPNSILGDGTTDSESAANMYMRISNLMSNGKTMMIRESAKLLVTGTENFDVCAFEPTTKGPFPAACLQRAFRQAGCQPAGTAHPTAKTAITYANMTWEQIHNEFTKKYTSMKSSLRKTQDTAVKECLGISYYREPTYKIFHPGRLRQGRNVGTVDIPTGNYRLSFDITPHGNVQNWGSIVHVTNDPANGNCCAVGNRSPGIWFLPGTTTIHVRPGDASDGNWGLMNTDIPLPIGVKSSFLLVAKDKTITVTTGGRTYTLTQPTKRPTGKQFHIFMADPWYDAANATVENFIFDVEDAVVNYTMQPFPGRPIRGRSIRTVNMPTGNYVLKFDITLQSKAGAEWENIFHLSTGVTNDRVIGIWVWPNASDISIVMGTRSGSMADQMWDGKRYPLTIGKKTSITLTLSGKTATSIIDGVTTSAVRPYTGVIGTNFKMYVSDPWYPPANAILDNLDFVA